MLETLRRLHRWIGIVLALPLIIEAATGLALAITPFWESVTAWPPSSAIGPIARPAAIIEVARGMAPDLVPIRYHPGDDPRSPMSVDLALPRERLVALRVLVDPVTLAVVATFVQPDEFYRFMHGLPERLLIPAFWGRSVIGWVGIGLLVLSISGVPIWWNSRRRSSTRVGILGSRLLRELHRGIGICLATVLAVQAFSGIALAFPQTVRALLGAKTELLNRRSLDAPPPVSDVDAILSRARVAVPDTRLEDLVLPSNAGSPAIVNLQPTTGGVPTQVFVDPLGHRVLAVQDPRGAVFGITLLLWLRALHAGAGLGVAWRIAVCAAALLLSLLPLTGLAMWWLRRRGDQAIRELASVAIITE
jgi:uncharacterized iron-regulated membrane protein